MHAHTTPPYCSGKRTKVSRLRRFWIFEITWKSPTRTAESHRKSAYKIFQFFPCTCENTAEEGGLSNAPLSPFEASEIVWKEDLCLRAGFPPLPLEKTQQNGEPVKMKAQTPLFRGE